MQFCQSCIFSWRFKGVDFGSGTCKLHDSQFLSLLQGAKAIAEMLKKNAHITSLELNNNVIDYGVTNSPIVTSIFRGELC